MASISPTRLHNPLGLLAELTHRCPLGVSCPRREQDFGGCRCLAFALTGDATAADPVCHLSPAHGVVAALTAVTEDAEYSYRHM